MFTEREEKLPGSDLSALSFTLCHLYIFETWFLGTVVTKFELAQHGKWQETTTTTIHNSSSGADSNKCPAEGSQWVMVTFKVRWFAW
jgi:hypothetical protein